MASALLKTKQYIKEYVGGVGWIRLMVMPVVIALIIANYLEIQYTNYSSSITSKDVDKDYGYLLLKWYVLLFVLSTSIKYFVNLFNVRFIAVSIRSGFKNFFHEYLMVRYENFHNIGVGEVQYNIVRRAGALSDFLTTLTMSFISNFFFFFLVVQSINTEISGRIRLVMFLSLIAFLTIFSFVQIVRASVRRKVNDGLQKNSRKIYDILFNYERIVAYDNLDAECEKYWDVMHDQTMYGIVFWVSYEITGFLSSLYFIFLNVYLISQFNMVPNMSVDNLKQFILLITKLREKLIDISRNIDEICTTFTNLDQNAIEDCPMDEIEEALQVGAFSKEIQMKNLSFSYDNKIIFRDVNYTILPGKKIAITGVNGAGKSTIIKILLGLYDYNGSLTLDGLEYRAVARKSIRDMIGYIPQNACLFDGTVHENLILADPGISDTKLVEYSKQYGMHDALREIGYSAPVGERGMNLSGGQKQKISFLRAIIKNAPILVLDEATSNMDIASELSVIELITSHMAAKTVIMIIHNLSLLSHFDEVLFFDNYTLGEHGHFSELIAADGRFSKFYKNAVKNASNLEK